MGKGDRKTRRGKIFRGTYGNLRPRKKRKKFIAVATSDVKSNQRKVEPKPKSDIIKLTKIFNKKTGESLIGFKQPDTFETGNPEKSYKEFFIVKQMIILGVPEEELSGKKKSSLEGKKIFIEAHKLWNEIKAKIDGTSIPENLIKLLATTKKAEQENLLKGIVFTPDLLAAFIFDACNNHGYKLCQLRNDIPQKGLDITKMPSAVEVKDNGDVRIFGHTEMSKGQLKQAVEHRKVIVGKFLEKNDHWHCFFTTFKSLGGKETWLGAKQPHYHYISNNFGKTKEEVINQLKSDKYKLGNLPHIKLEEYGKQPDE